MFLFFNILFELIIFQRCLLKISSIFGYTDELLTILVFLLTTFKLIICNNNRTLYKSEGKIMIGMTFFILLGLLSTSINSVQSNTIAIYKDILAISKFIILYIGSIVLSSNVDKGLLLKKVSKRSRIYINIIFIFSILNIFLDIGMHYGVRYGIRSFAFLYGHPTYLVSSVILLLCTVIADYKNKDMLTIIKGIIILVLTFRSKAFVFILSILFISFIVINKKQIKIRYIALIAIIGFMVTYDKINEVFYYGLTAARPALYIVGIALAKDLFPLGSGFGSFASSLSGEYYSNLYYKYRISGVMGLEPYNYNYMGDTFWPYIYGQFGVIGFIVFICVIIYIYKSIKQRYSYNLKSYISSMSIYVYILIASIAEAIFTDTSGAFSFIVLAVYLGYDKLSFENSKTMKNI